MSYQKESDMYNDVADWLQKFLQAKHKKSKIAVFNSSQKSLAKLIKDQKINTANLREDWQSWDIYVDITAFVISSNNIIIALVECKNQKITLSHISQLLGYSRVAIPQYSFIISPLGYSDNIKSLLLTFNRLDILEYHYPSGYLPLSITVATWDQAANSIDLASVIPKTIHSP